MKHARLCAAALAAALLAGCAPVPTPAPSSSPPAASTPPAVAQPAPPVSTASAVQADWSKLLGGTSPIQTDLDAGRWYPDYTDQLIPSPDYGELVPYVGANAYTFNTWTDQNGQVQTWSSSYPSPLYGLMTREGKIVTDPVYTEARQMEFYWQGETLLLPAFILSRASEGWQDSFNGLRCAVAALDGSWCTDFEFWMCTCRESELLLSGPGGIAWIDPVSAAREDWSWDFLGIDEADLPRITEEVMWLYGYQWTHRGVFLGVVAETGDRDSQVRIFNPETLEVSLISMDEWTAILNEWWALRSGGDTGWDSTVEGASVTLTRGEESYTLTTPRPTTSLGYHVVDGYAVLSDYSDRYGEQHSWLFRLSDQALLLEGRAISLGNAVGSRSELAFIQVQHEYGTFTIYRPDLSVLLELSPHPYGSWPNVTMQNGLLTVRDEQTFSCYDAQSGQIFFHRNLDMGD